MAPCVLTICLRDIDASAHIAEGDLDIARNAAPDAVDMPKLHALTGKLMVRSNSALSACTAERLAEYSENPFELLVFSFTIIRR